MNGSYRRTARLSAPSQMDRGAAGGGAFARRLGAALTVMVLIAGAVLAGDLAVRILPAIATASYWAEDVCIALMSPPQPQHPDIVIVAVTEDTLAALPYRSPLDRDFLAGLIERLEDAGARAIGLDILLDQPTEPEKDAHLSRVIETAPIPIIAGYATPTDLLTPRQAAFLDRYVPASQRGLVNLMTDGKLGTVRWIITNRSENGITTPGFAAALARAVGVEPPAEAVALAYRAPPDKTSPPFRTYPAHTLALLPKAWFAGKVVLIGSDLPLADRHRTPWAARDGVSAGSHAGVAIHAQALAQLLDRRSPPELGRISTLAILAGAAVLGLLLSTIHRALPVQIGTAAGGLAALWVLGFGLFRLSALMLPLVAMSLSYALAWAAGNAHWRGTAWRQREFIRQAFSQFTAPAIVDRLIANPEQLRLGGEKRHITTLFTDLSGFTAWFEQSDPQEALTVLSQYLSGMAQIAFEHGGTIDKIIGDALHLLFGAPLDQSDQATRAVRCALAMDAFGLDFCARQQAQGQGFGATRIGVHAGPAVVGNFGGDRFFNYTAYGDTVNTAARLESANKSLGGRVCVSGAVVTGCPDLVFRPVGALRLVGKEHPVDAFEPLAADSPALTDLAKYLVAFRLMKDDDQAALGAFEQLRSSRPDDWLYRLHAGRLLRGEQGTLLVLKDK
ncbi:MAG: adenylate/guanylate cyclase domain-containing protein [Rhodospirillales bacterium]|nr:adenylate/guanylate cyclase domain-containing protein [Rhodospirillales bacterium]